MSWFIGGPLVYVAIILFVCKTAAAFVKFMNMPRHLRWDLYPVPHQAPEGSKYQKVDFSDMKPHISLTHELMEMGQEMLFIKKAFINNPKVWKGSFLLHAGLYLGIVWLALLVVGALCELYGWGVASGAGGLTLVIYYLTLLAGIFSSVLGLLGSLELLRLRVTDEDLRFISDVVSYANLCLMILLFGAGLAAWALADPSYHVMRQHVASLLTLHPSTVIAPLVVFEMLMFSIFLIYLPFSRMMHFIGKYFFYHNIMWDDELMKRGSSLEKNVASCLEYNPTWGGPHIRKSGSWVDQASGGMPKDGE